MWTSISTERIWIERWVFAEYLDSILFVQWIEEYMNEMKGPTHSHYSQRRIKVRTTFRIRQDERIADFSEINDK